MLSTPTEADRKVMGRVGLDQKEAYAVMFRDEHTLRLLHHKTRDVVVIHRGDRPWPKE